MTRSEYLRLVCTRIESALFAAFPNHGEDMTLDDIEHVIAVTARTSVEMWGEHAVEAKRDGYRGQSKDRVVPYGPVVP